MSTYLAILAGAFIFNTVYTIATGEQFMITLP